MEEVAISRFKATCLELLRRVQMTGQPILVTRHGEPIAEVRPPGQLPRGARLMGCMEGTGEVLGDIISPAVPIDGWAVFNEEPPSDR